MVRATLLGALVVLLRVALGFGMMYWPTQGGLMRIGCLVVLLVAIVAWGFYDGHHDRVHNPEPESGTDLTLRWLKAGVLAGLGSGLVAWVLDYIPRVDLGENGVLFELTAGASFIVLLVFIPALIGVGIGRVVADRGNNKETASAPDDTVAASPA
ncbi:B-4DMT family transporter [Nocardia callitridis]|uniref:B-4DMT family transporter n=1 Tax=Nocardia callitridis TaxID=648753 RepID=A0ABP9KBI8_9NOCA